MSGTTGSSFVQWLLTEISDRGWTREEFARRAEINSSVLTHIVNGDRSVGSDVARQLAKGLGVGQVEIFERAGLINEKLDEDEKATREIKRLLSKMDKDRKRLALKVLESMADDDG